MKPKKSSLSTSVQLKTSAYVSLMHALPQRVQSSRLSPACDYLFSNWPCMTVLWYGAGQQVLTAGRMEPYNTHMLCHTSILGVKKFVMHTSQGDRCALVVPHPVHRLPLIRAHGYP